MTDSVNSRLKPNKSPDQTTTAHLLICVDARLIPRFLKLLERGFKVKITASLSIRELLCHEFGISDEYVDNRIQTIFLDGRPVDNVDTAWVQNGSKLALSAAMPGLVGATFRKGGFYASLRDTISYKKTENSVFKGAGEIILKLFNMVAKELGPELLAKGIRIEGNAFQNFVSRNAADLKTACTSIQLNDEKADVAGILKRNWENSEILLRVTSEKSA
jgi:hypothetical protein